ncbi:hypothetical protein SK128_016919 [Halocaridina rubra]|uniref:Uncharacterized protein n=1 Tax=Halocaridina rubra TaxID=373956 RepID=A0AAN8ZTT0_HALRR
MYLQKKRKKITGVRSKNGNVTPSGAAIANGAINTSERSEQFQICHIQPNGFDEKRLHSSNFYRVGLSFWLSVHIPKRTDTSE